MSQKTKIKKKYWLLSLVLIAMGSLVFIFKTRNSSHKEVTYKPSGVVRSDIKTTILSSGVAAPENRIDLKPPVTGRIEKILVEEGQKVKKGQVLAWMSSTERAALIDAAIPKGKEELKYWEDSYKMTPILAPGRGVIILKNSDAGQTVTQSDIILSMSDRLIVKASVDETDLAQVKVKQNVELVLDAFPENRMDAKVVHIGYDAKTVNNVTTYEVDVLAENTLEHMKSGMTANVTFLIDQRENVLTVPAAAIHKEKGKAYVLVPNSDPHGEPLQKEIKLGISDGRKVEVASGLEEGDTVLTAALKSSFKKDDKPGSPFSSSPFGGGRSH